MVNIGVIGCGGMGIHHAGMINKMENVTLAGVADAIEDKAVTLGNDLGTTSYTDYHDLLPHVNAVMICTPPFVRTDIVLNCAEANKHIFVEKPFALNLSDADRMIKAADLANVILMVGYVLRFTHPFQVIHETFASGALGRLVNCWTRRYMPFDTSKLWYGDQSKSGGITLDFASHDLDWICWVGGDARRVFGRVDRVRAGIGTDEHVHAMVVFDEGVGAIDDSWAPGMSDTSIGIVGSEGSMIVDRDGTIRKRIGEGDEAVVNPQPGETIQAHFVRCVREGTTPQVTGHDGRAVLQTVLAIQESARTGTAVAVR